MAGYIDVGIRKRCWNLIDSYGEICVGCGCCSDDKLIRYQARIECLKRWLEHEMNFDNWMDGFRELQEKNRKANIRYYKRRLRYYENALKATEGGRA